MEEPFLFQFWMYCIFSEIIRLHWGIIVKGLYIQLDFSLDQIKEDTESGVARKIFYQIDAFKNNGIEMDVINPLMDRTSFIYKVERRLPVTVFQPTDEIIDRISTYNFIYIRNTVVMDKYIFLLLKKVKLKNPSMIILLEVPTYPYDTEISTGNKLGKKPLVMIDRHIRKNLCNYIDRVITFSSDDMIWNIPTIRISNAIDYNKIQRRKIIQEIEDAKIEIIACAQLRYWHGYDRALQGLAEYYDNSQKGQKNFMLHIVGDGDELIKYKKFITENRIENHVILHGSLYGSALNDIYERCVIGLDSMGRHRTGVFYNSSLKGKEYLAKGLLVVSGVTTELDYDEEYKYYLRVPADDSSVDFTKVAEWVDALLEKETLGEIQNKIMEYARQNFDYAVSMKKIIEYLKAEKTVSE